MEQKFSDIVKSMTDEYLEMPIKTHNQLATDCISRQEAIDTMCNICIAHGHIICDKSKFVYNAPPNEQVILCPEHYALSILPSVQPERKKGKWIDECMCSCCGFLHENDDGYVLVTTWNFCPNCGADMRGNYEELED